jgi:hypothetical protein
MTRLLVHPVWRRGLSALAVSIALGAAPHGALADGLEISVQPRLWYNFYSDSQYYNNHRDLGDNLWADTVTTAYELPFYGGTIGVRHPAIGPGTLAITVLNGNAKNEGAMTWTNHDTGGAFPFTIQNKVHRLDAEALYIIPGETSASYLAGARYIGFDWKRTDTFNPYNPAETGTPRTSSDHNNGYYAELGIGLSTPLTRSGEHVVFANLTGLIGAAETNRQRNLVFGPDYRLADTTAYAASGGIDANVGYGYQLNESLKLSARYRVFARSNLQDWSSEGSELMHGPEIGLTYTFKSSGPLK